MIEMKSNPQIINILNYLLSKEQSAFWQYYVHEKWAEQNKYMKLASYIQGRRKQEEEHAGELMDQLYLFDETPNVKNTAMISTGSSVQQIFSFDYAAELEAIADYTAKITIVEDLQDYMTGELFRHILQEEKNHINDIEGFIAQMNSDQMGIPLFLNSQAKE
jgi:bacterioferritin